MGEIAIGLLHTSVERSSRGGFQSISSRPVSVGPIVVQIAHAL